MGDQVEPRRLFIEQNAKDDSLPRCLEPRHCSAAGPRPDRDRVELDDRRCARASLDYAMSVIVGRALPGRARRPRSRCTGACSTAMHEAGPAAEPARTSSAPRVVGDVMGNYHPHGDARDLRHARPAGAAVLACAIRSSTARELRLDRRRPGRGDAATPRRAWRAIATEMLRDIDTDTVDFKPNYDESRRRACRASCRFPNLLVNGSAGIAVGMATNIPPHNLRRGRSTRSSR